MKCKTRLFVFSGDMILYKRNEFNEWRGLGIVISQINQQVFVKHSNFYVRVHPLQITTCKTSISGG